MYYHRAFPSSRFSIGIIVVNGDHAFNHVVVVSISKHGGIMSACESSHHSTIIRRRISLTSSHGHHHSIFVFFIMGFFEIHVIIIRIVNFRVWFLNGNRLIIILSENFAALANSFILTKDSIFVIFIFIS